MVGQTVSVACIVIAGLVQAQEGTVDLSQALKVHAWEVAPEIYSFRYEEPGVMKDEGTFYGILASYTHHRERVRIPGKPDTRSDDSISWSTFKVEGRFSWGEVDYDGGIYDPDTRTTTPYEIEDIDDFVIGLGFLWGREWEPGFINGFHIGFAYRYLNDDTSFDPYGYEREANYFYVPVRLEAAVGSPRGWQLGFTGEVDVMLFGVQISHLEDVDSDAPTIYNWQYGGIGAQGSIALTHRSNALDFAVAPFVRYWWVPESEPDSGYVEPENNTLEYGLRLIFRF
jgi:hypothetical protein